MISKATQDLYALGYQGKEKELNEAIIAFALAYSKINYNISMYFLSKVISAYRKDKIDIDFEKLMKPLEREFKKENKKRKKNGDKSKGHTKK
jgi:hypothetical protein